MEKGVALAVWMVNRTRVPSGDTAMPSMSVTRCAMEDRSMGALLGLAGVGAASVTGAGRPPMRGAGA